MPWKEQECKLAIKQNHMNYYKTRMISLVLIFGIFFGASCSTLFSTTENPKTYLENEELTKAYNAVEEQLRDNPGDTELLLLRATILNEIALEKEDPADRHPDYKSLKNSTDEVRFQTDRYNSKIDSLLIKSWTYEQQEGVKLLQQDNPDQIQQNSDRITAHFRNAITLIPDSTVTYSLKATTHYKSGNTDKAIQTLESGRDHGVELGPEYTEKLAYLYLESGYFEQSVSLYQELIDAHPDNSKFKHGLVNALILKEDHEESVALLKDLIDQNPERHEYQEALAAELYFAESKAISKNIADQKNFSSQDIEKIIERFDEISSIYKGLNLESSRSEESLFRAASFHSHAAQQLHMLKESSSNADSLISEKNREFLELSVIYWQSLTEIFPDSVQYAEQLYMVYRELEMDDEADLIYRQLNF